MCQTWQQNLAVFDGERVVDGGSVYVCAASGTTAASGAGPRGIGTGGVITDGSAYLEYVGQNTVTSDPNTPIAMWAPSGRETAGEIIVVGGRIPGNLEYGVVAGGTAASTGTGPTGTGAFIVDGSATLTYFGVYQPSPYAQSAPILTYSKTQPLRVWWSASANRVPAVAATQIWIKGQGSGYAVNDTITLSTGTGTNASLKVTSVSSGAITGVAMTSGGAYTALPYMVPTPQGSTSGSGKGATFYLVFPEPAWCHINNGYLIGGSGSGTNFSSLANMSTGAGATATSRHISFQFQTDDPAPTFEYYNGTSNMQLLYDDGGGWTAYNQTNFPVIANSFTFYTFTFPGGRKWRKFRVETQFDNSGASIPYIGLDALSVPQTLIDNDTITCAAISDSLFEGSPVGPFSCGFHFAGFLGYLMDWNVVDLSKGGTGFDTNAKTYNTYGQRVSAALAYNPNIVLIFGSTNDIGYPAGTTTTNVQAMLTAIRAGGFAGPIIVWGVESVSAKALTQEGYLLSAVRGWKDPLNNTYTVPFSNATLPPIVGSYNNNPTPGGLPISSVNNFTTYINQIDGVHPIELAVVLEAMYARNYMLQNVLPLVH